MLIILFLMVASLNALVKNKLYSTWGSSRARKKNWIPACHMGKQLLYFCRRCHFLLMIVNGFVWDWLAWTLECYLHRKKKAKCLGLHDRLFFRALHQGYKWWKLLIPQACDSHSTDWTLMLILTYYNNCQMTFKLIIKIIN